MQQGLLVASHNELQRANHIPDFPDQAAITTFLRGLLTEGRTQVTWARDSGVPYNTLTNYFTAAAPKMSAENLLRLVISASQVWWHDSQCHPGARQRQARHHPRPIRHAEGRGPQIGYRT
jgi:hypothetical protein